MDGKATEKFILHWLYRFGMVMGLFPCALERKKIILQIGTLSVIYLLVMAGCVYLSLYVRLRFLVVQILGIVGVYLSLILIISNFVELWTKRKNWRFFYDIIFSTDSTYNSRCNNKYSTRIYPLASLTLLILMAFGNLRLWIKSMLCLIAMFLDTMLMDIQLYIMACFLLEVSFMVKRRTDVICDYLELLSRKSQISYTTTKYKLNILKAIFKEILNFNKHLNSIFGRKLALFLILCFVRFVACVNFFLDMSGAPLSIRLQILAGLLYFGVLTIIIAIAGDIIESSGYKMIKLLNILQLSIQDDFLKQQLSEFAALVTELRPSLSVAGFFAVNRKLLPMLLSSFSAYIIILIQLKQ
ncbi:unnamed protein product [Phyllotreta striolata]|uniref:Gustatory receptor n=1 Tax=Phyllotreta striolata TaxID=444603 RepID=A0A9N9TQ29_PHYSR|nr:unnamed protein product [Phyllotreta striolata]